MCAVAGIVCEHHESNAAAVMYKALEAQQHRGVETAGIVTQTDGNYEMAAHREYGMVRDVFDEDKIRRLAGSIALGHLRYSTSGSKKGHVGPFIDPGINLALGLNGNLPVMSAMDNALEAHNIDHRGLVDTDKSGHLVASYIRSGSDLPTAIKLAYPFFRGAFSFVAMHRNQIAAFRDPKGIRPLAMGHFDGGTIITSETSGLDIIGAEYDREVEPGEMVVVKKDSIESHTLAEDTEKKLDMFEFVYFARHDSYLYGKSVNEVRRQFGVQLAEQHRPFDDSNKENVLVVPIPDTSIPAAEGYAHALGLEHRYAVIKNRYSGRSFMEPQHHLRIDTLRGKHNIIREAVEGRDVILIDDSIVRFNTMPNLVKQALQKGAKSVSVLIASPPVRFPDHYGIDTPDQSELIASQLTVEEMRKAMTYDPKWAKYVDDDGTVQECRYLGFLSIDRMVAATGLPADMFNLSCFNNEYPINIGHHRKNIKEPVSWEYVKD